MARVNQDHTAVYRGELPCPERPEFITTLRRFYKEMWMENNQEAQKYIKRGYEIHSKLFVAGTTSQADKKIHRNRMRKIEKAFGRYVNLDPIPVKSMAPLQVTTQFATES